MLKIVPKFKTLAEADKQVYRGYTLTDMLKSTFDYNGSLKGDVSLDSIAKAINPAFKQAKYSEILKTWFAVTEFKSVDGVPEGYLANAAKVVTRPSGMSDEAYAGLVAAKARDDYYKFTLSSVRRSYPRESMSQYTDDQYEAFVKNIADKTVAGGVTPQISGKRQGTTQGGKQGDGGKKQSSKAKQKQQSGAGGSAFYAGMAGKAALQDLADTSGGDFAGEVEKEANKKAGEKGMSKFAFLLTYLTTQVKQLHDYVKKTPNGDFAFSNAAVRAQLAATHATQDENLKQTYLASHIGDAKISNQLFKSVKGPENLAQCASFAESKFTACTAALNGIKAEGDSVQMLECLVIPEGAKLEDVLTPVEVVDTDAPTLKAEKRQVNALMSELKAVLGIGIGGFTIFFLLQKFFPSWNAAVKNFIGTVKQKGEAFVQAIADVIDGYRNRAALRAKRRTIDPGITLKVAGGALVVEGVTDIMEVSADGKSYANFTVVQKDFNALLDSLPASYSAEVITLSATKSQIVIRDHDDVVMVGTVYEDLADITYIRSR